MKREMKRMYQKPTMSISDSELSCEINVNSINGGDSGTGYGGGADPSTGRGKDRNEFDYDEMPDENANDSWFEKGLW